MAVEVCERVRCEAVSIKMACVDRFEYQRVRSPPVPLHGRKAPVDFADERLEGLGRLRGRAVALNVVENATDDDL